MLKGVLPSPPDDRDYTVAQVTRVTTLPSKVTLEHKFKHIRDQSVCGVCVGKGTASLMSAKFGEELSSLYIYSRCKELDGIPDVEGTYPRVALKVAQKEGSCPDTLYPYVLQKCLPVPKVTEGMTLAAEKYKIGSYARAWGLNDIKRALANGHLVVGTIPIHDSFMFNRGEVIADTAGSYYGLHLIVFCGYDDAVGLRGVNSWGEGWGDNGFFWLSYDYPVTEAWTVVIDPLKPQPKNKGGRIRNFLRNSGRG